MEQVILFGAGVMGIKAFEYFGSEKVFCFCDNDISKQGTILLSKEIISFDKLKEIHRDFTIIVTPDRYAALVKQLEESDIQNYVIFTSFKKRNENFVKDDPTREVLKLCEGVDYFDDISAFRRIVKDVLDKYYAKEIVFERKDRLSESIYYGNLSTLTEYAFLTESYNIMHSPMICHTGNNPAIGKYAEYNSAVIVPGQYYSKRIHSYKPFVPVFEIGPYLHYAKGSFSEEEIRACKKANGRTLLYFVPHSIEDYSKIYAERELIDKIALMKNEFDTIYCCVYWVDLCKDICDYAEAKGMKIVSAGFRFDPQFNNRLKTFLLLADEVICGDTGTFIAYALYLNKKISLLKAEVTETERVMKNVVDEEYCEYVESVGNLLRNRFSETEQLKDELEDISGFSRIKSPEYIRSIFEISDDIITLCDENINKYPEAVREQYRRYALNGEYRKMVILRNSVGSYVD